MESTQLLKKIQSGDKQAFSAFYDAHSSLVYSIALRIVRSQQDASDILQEVFVAVWQKASQYTPKKGAPEAWLITLTRSRAIDLIRSRRRVDRKTERVKTDAELRGSAVTGEDAGERLMKLQLQWGLETLSDDEQVALQMCYFDGCVHTEIAARLGIPEGTVKTRIRSGLMKLRKALKKSNIERGKG